MPGLRNGSITVAGEHLVATNRPVVFKRGPFSYVVSIIGIGSTVGKCQKVIGSVGGWKLLVRVGFFEAVRPAGSFRSNTNRGGHANTIGKHYTQTHLAEQQQTPFGRPFIFPRTPRFCLRKNAETIPIPFDFSRTTLALRFHLSKREMAQTPGTQELSKLALLKRNQTSNATTEQNISTFNNTRIIQQNIPQY